MAERLITEGQYAELLRYEGGAPVWVRHRPMAALVSQGLIKEDYRARPMCVITVTGKDALSAFRARFGVKA